MSLLISNKDVVKMVSQYFNPTLESKLKVYCGIGFNRDLGKENEPEIVLDLGFIKLSIPKSPIPKTKRRAIGFNRENEFIKYEEKMEKYKIGFSINGLEKVEEENEASAPCEFWYHPLRIVK